MTIPFGGKDPAIRKQLMKEKKAELRRRKQLKREKRKMAREQKKVKAEQKRAANWAAGADKRATAWGGKPEKPKKEKGVRRGKGAFSKLFKPQRATYITLRNYYYQLEGVKGKITKLDGKLREELQRVKDPAQARAIAERYAKEQEDLEGQVTEIRARIAYEEGGFIEDLPKEAGQNVRGTFAKIFSAPSRDEQLAGVAASFRAYVGSVTTGGFDAESLLTGVRAFVGSLFGGRK